jgi:hypothetical protein
VARRNGLLRWSWIWVSDIRKDVPNMKHRKLRIAFSALCGVLCLLLIGLWVRSYWRTEGIARGTRGEVSEYSWREGVFYFGSGDAFDGTEDHPWRVFSKPLPRQHAVSKPRLLPAINSGDDHSYYVVPIWLPLLVFAALAIAPWCSPHSGTTNASGSNAPLSAPPQNGPADT